MKRGSLYSVYDQNGNNQGMYQSAGIPGTTLVWYDSQGNVQTVLQKGQKYYYNSDGTAKDASAPIQNVSQYKLTADDFAQIDAEARGYAGKTKCQLYPELNTCSN